MREARQINELLLHELGPAINQHAALLDALVTVTYVKCSNDLKAATIGISVLPENKAGTALRHVRRQSGAITAALKKRRLPFKYLPRLKWVLDPQERHAARIEKALDELNLNNK
jgi:ribosome-binding factor A